MPFHPWPALLAALASGLIAGTFFAFSAFVMRALARLPAPQGIAAMQSINLAVINPAFLGVFVGAAVVCCATATLALFLLADPAAPCLLAGSALYLLGTFGVTLAFNVPLNDALAKLSPTDPTAPDHWADYVRRWTRWNHVRAAAALAATGAFALAVRA